MKPAVLFVLAILPARAETFEWWQSTDVSLFSRERVSAVVHTQFRMRHHFRDFFQGRIGPVVRMPLAPAWNLTLGYYFGEAEESRDKWRNTHRIFAAADRALDFTAGRLTLRTTAEQHVGGGTHYRRLRQSAVWAHDAPLTPYWGTETFFDGQGFMSQRILGGIRRPLRDSYTLDIGYIYDIRQPRAGDHRHVIHTSLRPRRR